MFRLPKHSSSTVVISKPKNQGMCKYPSRKCSILALENYDYCLKHILEDKTAPYKPCPYLYTASGKKCGKPACRLDRKDTWFCAEHTRKAQVVRQKATSNLAPPQTSESLLASLSHYVPSHKSVSGIKEEGGDPETKSGKVVNPFVDLDAAQINGRSTQVLDYASESDSDEEPAMLDNVWRDQNNESSDAESVDSQADDPLKHAGVYTAEEVTTIMKDKMIRLQSLYIDQFRRLQHLLKERRRKYLHALKKEKETLCSIHNQERGTAKEEKLYKKLKALNHFHKFYGEEAILHKKALDRRAQVTEGTLVRTSHKGKCAFTEGGVKCNAKTLPVTKFCQKHILEDSQQVLFRACGVKRDDHMCQEPTLNVFEHATCVYHITLPAQPHSTLDVVEKTGVKEEYDSHATSQENDAKEGAATNMGTLQGKDVINCVPTDILKSEHTKGDGFTPKETISLKPFESVDIVLKQEESINSAESIDIMGSQPTTSTTESADEKMDIDNEISDMADGVSISANEKEDSVKQEELELVDISDVGVVEEVLDSEEKAEVEGNIQVKAEIENNTENKSNVENDNSPKKE